MNSSGSSPSCPWPWPEDEGGNTAFFLTLQSLSKRLQGCQEEVTPAHLPNNMLTTLTARFGEEEDVTVEQLKNLVPEHDELQGGQEEHPLPEREPGARW